MLVNCMVKWLFHSPEKALSNYSFGVKNSDNKQLDKEFLCQSD